MYLSSCTVAQSVPYMDKLRVFRQRHYILINTLRLYSNSIVCNTLKVLKKEIFLENLWPPLFKIDRKNIQFILEFECLDKEI
jgi:hypothetical protein